MYRKCDEIDVDVVLDKLQAKLKFAYKRN